MADIKTSTQNRLKTDGSIGAALVDWIKDEIEDILITLDSQYHHDSHGG